MSSPLTIQPPSKDNSLYGGSTTTNYGTSTQLTIQSRSFGNRNYRTIIAFGITWGTDIPAGATLTSATLGLYRTGGTSGRTYQAYKCTRDDWGETTSSWQRYKTSTDWTTAGGDYVTSDPSGGSATSPSSNGFVSWDVLAIVQDAQTNNTNINIIIKDSVENNQKWLRGKYRCSKNWSDTGYKACYQWEAPQTSRCGNCSWGCVSSGTSILERDTQLGGRSD